MESKQTGWSLEPDALGEKIREAREELKMTQLAFGRAVGVHAMTVSQWERGERLPSLENFGQILLTTHRSVRWFLGSGTEQTGDVNRG